MADFPLIFGPLIGDVGKVVVIGDLSVGVFSLGLSVVSGEPLLGRDGRWLRGLVRLTGGELSGSPFGGSPGFRGVGVPGCAGLVGFD